MQYEFASLGLVVVGPELPKTIRTLPPLPPPICLTSSACLFPLVHAPPSPHMIMRKRHCLSRYNIWGGEWSHSNRSPATSGGGLPVEEKSWENWGWPSAKKQPMVQNGVDGRPFLVCFVVLGVLGKFKQTVRLAG